jgi:asparagine synthase (glutamine-hydrolysing)
MYSIIAVDRESGSFLGAVDPLGIKPLSWVNRDGRVLIASEPKAFRACGVELVPDRLAISDYLCKGTIRSDSSGYLNVQRLSPGEWCLFSSDGGVVRGTTPYLKDQGANGDWEGARRSFADAVDSHMLSDVPIALLLSDGVDSIALACDMSLRETDFVSLTVDLGSGRDDSSGARATSDMLGMSLIEVREELDAEDVAGFFARLRSTGTCRRSSSLTPTLFSWPTRLSCAFRSWTHSSLRPFSRFRDADLASATLPGRWTLSVFRTRTPDPSRGSPCR